MPDTVSINTNCYIDITAREPWWRPEIGMIINLMAFAESSVPEFAIVTQTFPRIIAIHLNGYYTGKVAFYGRIEEWREKFERKEYGLPQ